MPICENALDNITPVKLHLTISIEIEAIEFSEAIKDMLERLEKWPLYIDIVDARILVL